MSGVLLLGEPAITPALARRLHQVSGLALGQESDITSGETDCVLLFVSAGHSHNPLDLQSRCQRQGVPLLHIAMDTDELRVGPWFLQGELGCVRCLELRRWAVRTERAAYEQLRRHRPKGSPFTVPFPPIAIDCVAALVMDEVSRLLKRERPHLIGKAWIASTQSLIGKIHRFSPSPDCPFCAIRQVDSPDAGRLALTPRIKADPRCYRAPLRPISLEELREGLVDWRLGVVSRSFRVENARFLAYTHVDVPHPPLATHQVAVGRTADYGESEFTAILEGLERYAGFQPRTRQTSVVGTYANLTPHAVDPRELAQHPPECYETPGFPYQTFSPDRKLKWVWGYSFRRCEPVLIPETLAYYRLPAESGEPGTRFVYENSNGCSLGGSLEEAILHGLLETIERDAFLLTWYARLPVSELSLEGIQNQHVLLLADALEHAGYRLHLFNLTLDFEVPCIWAMVVNPESAVVKTYSSAGAHLDPEKALFGALVELASVLPNVETGALVNRGRALKMLADSSQVTHMDDHGLLYAQPEAFDRLSFLFNNGAPVPFRTAFAKWYNTTPPADLTEDLLTLTNRALGMGLDVWVVDQTPPEAQPFGLYAAKVLVTGTLPMTFGHHFRRTEGVPRLLTVPHQLGYTKRPLLPSEINQLPHPFP